MSEQQTERAARAFLMKRGIKGFSPAKYAAAAKELQTSFSQLAYFLGLLYDGPRSLTQNRKKLLDEEQMKLLGAKR